MAAVYGDGLQRSYSFGRTWIGSAGQKVLTPCKGYLFGHPIALSLGPILHHTLWQSLHVPWKFALVDSMDKDDFLPLLKSEDCFGASVTMPHKVTIMTEVDYLTEEAEIIGSINTLFVRIDANSGARRYIGTNTDCIGIREAFLRSFPGCRERVRDGIGLVVGGGGTTRAALYALWKFLDMREVYIVNRLDTEVEALVLSLAANGCSLKMTHVRTPQQASQQCATPSIVVGCVPDILPETEDEVKADNITRTLLEKLTQEDAGEGYLLDMCYHPNVVTRLIRMAKACGWQTISGIEALVAQGIAQNELWLERSMKDINADEIYRAVRNASEKH